MKKILCLNNCVFEFVEEKISHLLLVFLRIWVAIVFFKAGWIKLNNWDSTIFLFSDIYQVPILSPFLAAVLGTFAELFLPIVLILGIFTRFFAICLFVFNIVAVISYPFLLEKGFSLFSLGAMDHQIWGLMLLVTIIFGAGKLSLDHLLLKTK